RRITQQVVQMASIALVSAFGGIAAEAAAVAHGFRLMKVSTRAANILTRYAYRSGETIGFAGAMALHRQDNLLAHGAFDVASDVVLMATLGRVRRIMTLLRYPSQGTRAAAYAQAATQAGGSFFAASVVNTGIAAAEDAAFLGGVRVAELPHTF